MFITSSLSHSPSLVLKECVDKNSSRSTKVSLWQNPDQLKKIIDFELKPIGTNYKTLFELLENVIKYSVKVNNPRFVNQLYSGLDAFGLAAETVVNALNPSIYTYEVAPVFTTAEKEVITKLGHLIGYPPDKLDGMFGPGGSFNNFTAISLARHYLFPMARNQGNPGKLVAFCSERAHYSCDKAAILLGLGLNNMVKVESDNHARMKTDKLESEIQRVKTEGGIPFCVIATLGTTVEGAIDPINEIEVVCRNHNLWLHADATWGGGLLMSRKFRIKLAGIEKADSVTWNMHKLLAAPQQCAAILTRHPTILLQSHKTEAKYLFQKDKYYDKHFDLGDKSLQCGRVPESFKMFLMWKAKGTLGFEQHINHLMNMAAIFVKMIRNERGFELIIKKPEITNICFWYVPIYLRSISSNPNYPTFLNAVAPLAKEYMVERGSMMITYQPFGDKPNFFRLVLQSSAITREDIAFFVEEIKTICESKPFENDLWDTIEGSRTPMGKTPVHSPQKSNVNLAPPELAPPQLSGSKRTLSKRTLSKTTLSKRNLEQEAKHETKQEDKQEVKQSP